MLLGGDARPFSAAGPVGRCSSTGVVTDLESALGAAPGEGVACPGPADVIEALLLMLGIAIALGASCRARTNSRSLSCLILSCALYSAAARSLSSLALSPRVSISSGRLSRLCEVIGGGTSRRSPAIDRRPGLASPLTDDDPRVNVGDRGRSLRSSRSCRSALYLPSGLPPSVSRPTEARPSAAAGPVGIAPPDLVFVSEALYAAAARSLASRARSARVLASCTEGVPNRGPALADRESASRSLLGRSRRLMYSADPSLYLVRPHSSSPLL